MTWRNMIRHDQNTPRQYMRECVLTQSEHTETIYERTCPHMIRAHLDNIWELFPHNQNALRQEMRELDTIWKTCSRTIRTHLDKIWKKLLAHNRNTPRQYMWEHALTQNEHTWTIYERSCSHTIRTHLDKTWANMPSHNQNTPRQEMRVTALTPSEHT